MCALLTTYKLMRCHGHNLDTSTSLAVQHAAVRNHKRLAFCDLKVRVGFLKTAQYGKQDKAAKVEKKALSSVLFFSFIVQFLAAWNSWRRSLSHCFWGVRRLQQHQAKWNSCKIEAHVAATH